MTATLTVVQERQTVRVRVPAWFADKHQLVSRELEGEVIAQTAKAILLRGKAVVRESRYCLRCDREITNPASILVGYGPECARKLLKSPPAPPYPPNAQAPRRARAQLGEVELWIRQPLPRAAAAGRNEAPLSPL